MNAETFHPRCGIKSDGIRLSLSSLHWDNVLWLYEDKIIVETSANKYYWRFLDLANHALKRAWDRHVEREYSSNPKLAAAIFTGVIMCKLFKALKDLA